MHALLVRLVLPASLLSAGRSPAMRILMILLALLPFLTAEEIDPQALRNDLQRAIAGMQHSAGEVARTAAEAEMQVVPALLERMRLMRDEIAGQVEALKEPKPDTAKAMATWRRFSDLTSGASQVSSQFQALAEHAKRVSRAPDGPALRKYLGELRGMATAMMTRVAVEEKIMPETPSEQVRRRQLEVVLRMLLAERAIANRPLLPAAESPVSEFTAWCERTRMGIDEAMTMPPAVEREERERQAQQMMQALNHPERLLSHWQGLLAAVERRREAERPPFTDADGPGLPALRTTLEQKAELLRKIIAILAGAEALSLARHEEVDLIERDSYQLDEVERVSAIAIDWQRDFTRTRATLAEQFAKCPESVRKSLQGRLEQIATDALKFQGRRLKALADRDRVDAVEAEGDMELVQIRLLALSEETESERGITEGEALWRGKEKDPALRELAQRYQEQRRKLSDAQAKLLKAQLQWRQIENRIALLRLKADLTGTQVDEALDKMRRLSDELGQLHQELGEAAAKAGERAKDAKDAERIPLVKPGVDDF